jgi:hypothetical protein
VSPSQQPACGLLPREANAVKLALDEQALQKAENEEMTRILVLAGAAVTLVGLSAAGHRRLTLSEAERLARAAVSDEAKRLPGFYLEPPLIAPKNGATFDALWDGRGSDKERAQSLVVDIDTAEVWDATTCQYISTSAVTAVQTVIRRELKILAIEVSRARAEAQKNGCSNLIDQRPKLADFHPARVISVDPDKNGEYRYTVRSGGCHYRISSPTPLEIRNGEVKFVIIASAMYAIDDRGRIREVQYERGVCV